MKQENVVLAIFLIGFFTLFLMYILTPPEQLTLMTKLNPKENQEYYFSAKIDSISEINNTKYATITTTITKKIIIPKIQNYLHLYKGQNIEIEAKIKNNPEKDKQYLEIKEIRII